MQILIFNVYWKAHEEIDRRAIATGHYSSHTDISLHLRLALLHIGLELNFANLSRLEEDVQHAFQACYERPIFYDDVRIIFDCLTLHQIPVVLSTVSHAQEKARATERFFGRELFLEAFDEQAIGYAKVDPRYYIAVAHILGSKPEYLLVIGDGVYDDIWSSRKAGCRNIHILRNGQRKASFADIEVSTLREAVVLLSLNQANDTRDATTLIDRSGNLCVKNAFRRI